MTGQAEFGLYHQWLLIKTPLPSPFDLVIYNMAAAGESVFYLFFVIETEHSLSDCCCFPPQKLNDFSRQSVTLIC